MSLTIPQSEFAERRARLLKRLAAQTHSAIAIVPSAELTIRSRDTEFPFRQDSDFFYLTGFNEPGAVLVLAPDSEMPVQLYCQPSDPHQEVWHGRRLGVALAVAELGVDVAHAIDELDDHLLPLLDGVHTVLIDHEKTEWLAHVQDLSAELRQSKKKGQQAPRAYADLSPWLHEWRLQKSPAELDIMREAARITVAAHKRAMRFAAPGRYEYQVAAELHHEFAFHGASAPAYGTICGSGENACILHYTENQDQLRDGDLLLIDAGAEYQGYAADITRTFPVNGKFSATQRQLYEVVLRAQEAAFATLKPGSHLQRAQQAAAKEITKGLVELGILQGEVTAHMEQGSYRRFFIHGLGHWLGLDVHDVGDYQKGEQLTALKPGMVLTVEPGIYIPADADDVEDKWRGMGIRIEDDVIITESGYENMTADVPKTVAEIEAWMQTN
ncbi:Xaa-Pro aminopeptidase [Pseudidiomarina sp. 1APP75-32.1]|uniref:Xaa-Pro aminopeptidase n=1 Tax=Pseudidiomarina terrestris TaxID=2820060 RepID=A0AAW7R3M9_9GAMM|nr:Xaa-Pro aminopeptidase [Pseudidiomarina sp. 1APP75-32.1]MDN7125104.1 Xaa-Pro aminopeptidase [Pseudidiomarina sp. 1APP75-32.1]